MTPAITNALKTITATFSKFERAFANAMSNTSKNSVFFHIYNNISKIPKSIDEHTKVQREIRDQLKILVDQNKKK